MVRPKRLELSILVTGTTTSTLRVYQFHHGRTTLRSYEILFFFQLHFEFFIFIELKTSISGLCTLKLVFTFWSSKEIVRHSSYMTILKYLFRSSFKTIPVLKILTFFSSKNSIIVEAVLFLQFLLFSSLTIKSTFP